jgi:hypothetical protein
MTKRVLVVLLLAACSSSHHATPDMAGPDMAGYPRTLITRALMPTPPQNLLRDPLVGAEIDPDFGQFYAFYDNGGDLQLARTFESQSPVGGAVSIEHVPLSASAHDVASVMATFPGGGGSFQSSVWMSFADSTGAPKSYADVSATVSVYLFDNEGNGKFSLLPSSEGQVTYGSRSWVKLVTDGAIALPAGGWFDIDIGDSTLDVEVAAPYVTSIFEKPTKLAKRIPMTDRDRAAMERARKHARPARHHLR